MNEVLVHPGEHVKKELDALGMSAAELAAKLNVDADAFANLLSGCQELTADLALRLAHVFGMSARFWMNLQDQYDIRLAEDRNGDSIAALPTLKQVQAA